VNVVFKKVIGGVMERIIARIFEEILNRMSPELQRAIAEKVIELEKVAKGTVNPWDDVGVILLKIVLKIET